MKTKLLASVEDDGRLSLSLYEIFDGLSEEEQRAFIKRLALQPRIIEMVSDYLCGEDPDGCWTTEEPELRQRILSRIEKAHIDDLASTGPRYGWRVWSDIQQKIKDIVNKKEVYWALHHDRILGDQSYDFFKRHGIESNYTTKAAEEDIAKISELIKNAFKEMGACAPAEITEKK